MGFRLVKVKEGSAFIALELLASVRGTIQVRSIVVLQTNDFNH